MKKTDLANETKMLAFTFCLGAFAGAVIWCFLKAVSGAVTLLWGVVPAQLHTPYLSIAFCVLGGVLLGFLHKKYGDYPDELSVVMQKVRKEKHYPYHPMLVMLVCAFLPLALGASVGPEAGLTGIIAALCYWVGDNVTYAKKHEAEYSRIGEAVTLGQLFHSPLFGIFVVEEGSPEKDGALLPRGLRLLYYAVSTVASFLVIGLLNRLFGEAMGGFPHFDSVAVGAGDYAMMLLYVPVGIALSVWFIFSEKITKAAAEKIPPVVKEVIGGAAIAVAGLVFPVILFSGEEEMAELMAEYGSYLPVFLAAVCILKLLMTAFCIRFGWKGGHFFPVIFACTCMGFALSMAVFSDPGSHVVFGAGIVTAAALGAQIRKPFAVSVLLLLCFPARMLFWIFLAALLGGRIGPLLIRQLFREKKVPQENQVSQ